MELNRITLEGARVIIKPLETEHIPQLYHAAQPAEIWTYLPNKIESIEDMHSLVESSLGMQQLGLEYPFVVFDKVLERIVGSTRFLNISLANKSLEVGWTWYSPEVWRTRVNTECKYLLLSYCFQELSLVRVQFKADIRNERSNKALERIGAVKEGTLRQDRILHDGYIRNSHTYSIIDQEWSGVKEKLERFLV